MSELIKITFVIENSDGTQKEVCVAHDTSMTVMSTLLKEDLISDEFCGGRGVCQRCRIRFMNAAPLPTAVERAAFSPDELRAGSRLACAAKPRNDCVIRLEFIKKKEINIISNVIITDVIKTDLRKADGAEGKFIIAVDIGTTTIAMQLMNMATGEVVDTYCAMNPQRAYGADVLSRIQAAANGYAAAMRESVWKVIDDGVGRFSNEESVGKDAVSKESVSKESVSKESVGKESVSEESVSEESVSEESVSEESVGKESVSEESVSKDAVIKEGGSKKVGVHYKDICCMCIAGNTTMEHILMNLSTEGLGKSPFTPIELGIQKCGREKYGFPVYITPGMSAFVGGDIAAGLYHCGLLTPLMEQKNRPAPEQNFIPEQKNRPAPEQNFIPKQADRPESEQESVPAPELESKFGDAVLFIDLGTNGEMAIAAGDRLIATATAAGPAFEGGAGAAAPGSDMVKIAASLLEKNIMDKSGLLAEPYFDEGIDVNIGETAMQTAHKADMHPIQETSIHLTQSDIRAFQMAKAAVRAGIDILCKKMGSPKVVKVYLAGGFGYYLDIDSAAATGLLPENLRSCTQAVGNTSLAGAFDMGRDLWLGSLDEEALDGALRRIETINLAKEDDFEKLYIRYLDFRE